MIHTDLGHPITRSSVIRDLGDVQIDLSRKYRGSPKRTVIGIDSIGTDLKPCVPYGTGAASDLLKAEITDTADILQFNSRRIMRYVFLAIA